MKRIAYILLLLLLVLPASAGLHNYAEQSVLRSGHWVKIRVSESGVCKMTYAELRNAGLDPQQLRVFGYGGAMLDQDFQKPRIDDLPQVPVYKGDDYVLFWVQGPIAWTYNGSRFAHTRNPYSDYGYYLLTDNVGSLLEPATADAIEGTATDVTAYMHCALHELDSLNLVDRSGVSGGGREFYGEQFNAGQKRIFRLSTPNAIAGEQANVYVTAAGYSNSISQMQVSANGTAGQIALAASTDIYTMAQTGAIYLKATAASQQQTVQLTYSGGNSGALGWLNYIELNTPCSLQMQGGWMAVRSTVNYQSATPVRFHLSNANSRIQIWDATDRSRIVRIPATLSGSELQWTGSQLDGIHEYVAVDPQGSGFVKASVVGDVANQNLHRLRNIDYVIICPEGYQTYARELAQAHETKEGITWAVVTDKQVYNEFSSGTPDATAYRWLMKMLYDRADGVNNRPRWLLLMGHGSFDNRKLLPQSGTSLLLTYEAVHSTNEVHAYATDDYFGFLDDNEGTSDTQAKMDIGVGRLPVCDQDEAREVVDKLIAYIRNDRPGKWKNQIVFLADDGDHGDHTKTAEGGAERVRVKNKDFIVNKIYLDAYPQEVNASGESYPLAKIRLDNLLKSGVLFFDYSGHGGFNAITSEGMLSLKDITAMNNEHQAFWLFATCSFAHCDAGKRSAAELAVLNPKGGAIGVLSATRTVYADENTRLNRSVCDTLFGHKDVYHYDMTLGEATAIGKNLVVESGHNKMAYVLLGDPALRLNYPTDYQVATDTPIDTLNALSVQQVEGRIIDEDGQTVSDFNGEVAITIYDKMQVVSTRDNDAVPDEAQLLQYNDYPNTIFIGSASVKDGEFAYTFMVPKDIRYNYGNGRIVYYAHTTDSAELMEAVGHYEDFTIGGTGSVVTVDTVPPQMHIYLNTPDFQDGGWSYSTPRFFAELYDENGINTAGAGIGHDLMLIIDDDPKQTYSLNEYFTAYNGSYQAGMVSYLMGEMEDGLHSLVFRAWDLLNNSTTQSLTFHIQAGIDLSISSVTTYPNPVQQNGVLTLLVNYDQPDETIQTEVYIFNMSGQMLWRHEQSAPDIVQIPLQQIGIQPGMYLYNVRIKTETSKYSTAAGKIIVTR